MPAIQIRDVPDDVRDALAAQAAAGGQSMQGYLLTLLIERARSSRNVAVLHRFAHRDDGSRLAPGDTALEVAQERARNA